jgi:cytochrome P450
MTIEVQAIGLGSVPRAPGRLPLIGHAWPLWRRTLAFLKSLRNTGELVRVDVGTLPVYFVTTAELTHELLVTKARSFDKGRLYDRTRSLVGNGLATSAGEDHRRHRRLMQPMFHQARVAGYAEIMAERARALADSWEPGQTVAVDKALFEFSVATLAETLFSTDIGRPAAEAFRRDVPILFKNMLLRAVTPKVMDRLPIPSNRQFDAATARLRQVIDDVIAATHQSNDSGRTDLLSTLLAARDADTGEGMSDEEVRDQLVTIMFAGSETTATTLAWAFHEIARHPEVEQRLTAEIDAVVGMRPIRFEDVPKLEYTRRVLNEVARLHAVPLLMRRATVPVVLGGVHIPAGTEIAFSLYALHQDARLYPEPERFDPDRWLPDQRTGAPREAFIPFGAGNRKCIGDAFAWTEMTITLATIAARWQLRPVPGCAVREATSAVAHPDRLPMTPFPRAA